MDVFGPAIEAVRPRVISGLRGLHRMDLVDLLLQEIRVTAWERCAHFDPQLGTFEGFVQGIAAMHLRRVRADDPRYRLAAHVPIEEVAEELPATDLGPASVVESAQQRRAWLELVADHIDPRDWWIAVAMAQEGADAAGIAQAHGVSVRAVRSIRERVASTGETIRSAMRAAEQGKPATMTTSRECLPDRGRLRAVAEFVPDRTADIAPIAAATGLSPSQLRHQIPTARRLVAIAFTVIKTQRAA